MGIKNDDLGGTDWANAEVLNATDLNDTFNAVNSLVPIGTIQSWLKSYTNTPALPDAWVECNGQTLSDAGSVYNGQTIPDLNGANRFLRGSSASGTTGGAATHTLTIAQMPNHRHSISTSVNGTGSGNISTTTVGPSLTNFTGFTGGGNAHNNEPQYYNVVWIMRVK